MIHNSLDITWGDEGASIEEENLSSNVDSNFGFHSSYGVPISNDPLLEDCTYEQLLSELSRRNLELKENVTLDVVKKTYRIEKQLGKGSSGTVHLVYHKGVGKRFALKVIDKSGPLNDQLSMATEIDIMKRINHPRIIRLYELYESPECKWLILELLEAGGLRSKLSSMNKRFKENLAAKFIKQILEGLQYLHNHGIIHRDVKIDNILFTGDVHTGSAKITDFGLSAFIKPEQGYPSDLLGRKQYKSLKAAWGTPTHYSPELINGAYGPQTDMWSLGCVVYEMLTGCNAFPPAAVIEQSKYKDLFKRIKSCSYNRSKLFHLSKDCRNFLDRLLIIDPVARMSPCEALNHPWIVNNDERENRIMAMGVRRMFPKNILSFDFLGCLGGMKKNPKKPNGVFSPKLFTDSQKKNDRTGSESVRSESVHSENTSDGDGNNDSDGDGGNRNNGNSDRNSEERIISEFEGESELSEVSYNNNSHNNSRQNSFKNSYNNSYNNRNNNYVVNNGNQNNNCNNNGNDNINNNGNNNIDNITNNNYIIQYQDSSCNNSCQNLTPIKTMKTIRQYQTVQMNENNSNNGYNGHGNNGQGNNEKTNKNNMSFRFENGFSFFSHFLRRENNTHTSFIVNKTS